MRNNIATLLLLAAACAPAFALLENAGTPAEAVPHASDEWLAMQEERTTMLTNLIETQLEQIEGLSGFYVGAILVRLADEGEQGQPQIELLRIARLQEGKSRQQVMDAQGIFEVDMTLAPVGPHWRLDGSVDYRDHHEPKRKLSAKLSYTLPEGVIVLPGLAGLLRESILEQNANKASASEGSASVTDNRLSGYFTLRTADAPDPKDSPSNPVHNVQLPSGRLIQLEPGLSPAAAREVIAAAIREDAATASGGQTVDR